MGFNLTVLTARSIHFREPTLTWFGKWFPQGGAKELGLFQLFIVYLGAFDHVYFAEDLKHVENKAEVWSWPTKVDVGQYFYNKTSLE